MSSLNPMPQGPRFVDQNGTLTQEAYWFLLTLFTGTQNLQEDQITNVFAQGNTSAASDPVVAAMQRAQSFAAQVSDALQKIAAIQLASVFQPPAPQSFSGEVLIAPAEWLSGVAGTNAITGSTTPSYAALGPGFMVRLQPVNTNTAATTLNVNGTGASAIVKSNGITLVALVGGELVLDNEYLLMWDPVGTQWQLIGMFAPPSAVLLASNAAGIAIAAALASGKLFVGSAGNLPVAQAPGGDLTMDNLGNFTLDAVNAGPGAYPVDGAHVPFFTVNAKGLITLIANAAITGAPGDFAAVGNLEAVTAGKGLQVAGGANARVGSGTLVAGTLAVANTSVTANTKIFVQDTGGGVVANIGSLYVASKTPGTGFTVTSTNPLDTSNFDYFLVETL